MGKFNVGDKVRVVSDTDETKSKRVLGEVLTIKGTTWAANDVSPDARWYQLETEYGEQYSVYEKNLALPDPKYTYPFTVLEGGEAVAGFKTRKAAEDFVKAVQPVFTIEESA